MKLAKIKKTIHLSKSDLELPSRTIPGEWIILEKGNIYYLAFVNDMAEPFSCIITRPISFEEKNQFIKESEDIVARREIAYHLRKALSYRMDILPYGKNARLFYGESDGLTGLIIDGYQNAVLIEINRAGIDRFRDSIKEVVTNFLDSEEVYFFDKASKREREKLPSYEKKDILPNHLSIKENEISYKLPEKLWQKIGYYYDHRENRKSFYRKLTELKLKKNTGLDLFCYIGSWGLNALKAGVQKVDFVDQADMGEVISANLKENYFEEKGEFKRGDVFDLLVKFQMEGRYYDIVISDPPSFAKSLDKKHQALQGYKKLHRGILKLLRSGSSVVFASCTHYVTADEFVNTITTSAQELKMSLRMIDCGMQGLDHPIRSFSDPWNYIKYYYFLVE